MTAMYNWFVVTTALQFGFV